MSQIDHHDGIKLLECVSELSPIMPDRCEVVQGRRDIVVGHKDIRGKRVLRNETGDRPTSRAIWHRPHRFPLIAFLLRERHEIVAKA